MIKIYVFEIVLLVFVRVNYNVYNFCICIEKCKYFYFEFFL